MEDIYGIRQASQDFLSNYFGARQFNFNKEIQQKQLVMTQLLARIGHYETQLRNPNLTGNNKAAVEDMIANIQEQIEITANGGKPIKNSKTMMLSQILRESNQRPSGVARPTNPTVNETRQRKFTPELTLGEASQTQIEETVKAKDEGRLKDRIIEQTRAGKIAQAEQARLTKLTQDFISPSKGGQIYTRVPKKDGSGEFEFVGNDGKVVVPPDDIKPVSTFNASVKNSTSTMRPIKQAAIAIALANKTISNPDQFDLLDQDSQEDAYQKAGDMNVKQRKAAITNAKLRGIQLDQITTGSQPIQPVQQEAIKDKNQSELDDLNKATTTSLGNLKAAEQAKSDAVRLKSEISQALSTTAQSSGYATVDELATNDKTAAKELARMNEQDKVISKQDEIITKEKQNLSNHRETGKSKGLKESKAIDVGDYPERFDFNTSNSDDKLKSFVARPEFGMIVTNKKNPKVSTISMFEVKKAVDALRRQNPNVSEDILLEHTLKALKQRGVKEIFTNE